MGRRDEFYMRRALELAAEAAQEGEIPVGALIVKDGEIIAEGKNCRERDRSALAHAEMSAIAAACGKLNSWRLSGCEIFVTLEPCPMCAGAIINARIERLVFAAKDSKAGAAGSVANLFHMQFAHKPLVKSGVLAEESKKILQRFFQNILRR
ncbi:MAG: nucleoside deaminase [Oscillospiraceae bacterium]|jgi:tRNA(adenine34) deaminase|nr:nucleoside deaminase [Oscillospiraceae bacterium]